MSKLDELLRELCPDGVEYVKIGEVVYFEQPSKYIVKNTDYKDEYPTPVLTAGQTFILGYTNEENGHYKASKNQPVIIFDDFTGAFKWVDFEFKVKSSAMKILTADVNRTTLRYIYHIMGKIGLSSSEHKRLWIGMYSEFTIPLPPLEVQREIVRILDNFTDLTAELTAELTARKLQYKYYCKQIIESVTDAELISIGDWGKWSGGSTPSMANSAFWENGTIPWVSSKDMKNAVLIDTDDHVTEVAIANTSLKILPKNVVAIVARSGILKHTLPIVFIPIEVTVNQDIKALVCNERVLPKYAYFALQGYHDELLAKTKKQGGTVDSLEIQKFMDFKIPVPSIAEQQRIVDILDRFNTLCNDISDGLPAEIEARQKQYEYYRDKLLTFKELA